MHIFTMFDALLCCAIRVAFLVFTVLNFVMRLHVMIKDNISIVTAPNHNNFIMTWCDVVKATISLYFFSILSDTERVLFFETAFL